MSFNLPKIYPITDTRLSGLSHAEQVERLLGGGATLIQLRDKVSARHKFYHDAAEALRITHNHHARLIVNDRVDVALAIKADGVHLGQSDIPVEAARRLLGKDAIIGFSTHNIAQAKLATRLPINYLAFGPIFQTSTKENPDPVAGLTALRDVRSIIGSLPLVAIGGINVANAEAVFNAGADSVAVIGALLANSANIDENMRKMFTIASSEMRGSSGG